MFNLNKGLWSFIIEKSGENIHDWQFILLTVGFAFIAMASGYLLGSINSAIIVSKTFYHEDIRTHGSGNAGLTNILRTYGMKAAVFTLIGDFLKTAISICIGGLLGGFGYVGGISVGGDCVLPLVYIAGFFSIIGHILPIYYQFKGGKGVLCTATMALILTPIVFLMLLLLFVFIVGCSKYVSLGSVSVAVLYPVAVSGYMTVLFGSGSLNGVVATITILIAITVVYCHRENLKRISERTERKISIGGNKKNNDNSKDS